MDIFLKDTFRCNGLKLTPQRIAIYNYLKDNFEHPSADKIFNDLHLNYPTLSLATVYKALKTFLDCGLIQEINLGEGNFRYDFNTNSHPHVQCIKCNKIVDLNKDISNKINNILVKETDIVVHDLKIYMFGTCPDCIAKELLA